MSFIKTKCPNLEELSIAIGSIDGTDTNKSSQPLCENIFDVQRNEVFEVLERLRQAFWSDTTVTTDISPPIIPPIQVDLPTLKRVRTEQDEESEEEEQKPPSPLPKKRVRLGSIPAPTQDEKHKPVTYYSSLWPFKKLLLQRIKNTTAYKDADLIQFINQIYQTKSKDQCRHLSTYLLPVTKAMRKQPITDLLNQWL